MTLILNRFVPSALLLLLGVGLTACGVKNKPAPASHDSPVSATGTAKDPVLPSEAVTSPSNAPLKPIGITTGAPGLATSISSNPYIEATLGSTIPSAATWTKARWIEKAAKALRNGHGLGQGDNLPALLALPESKIVEHFMADPRFIDTVLDFGMFFLGQKSDSIRDSLGSFDGEVFSGRAAITAAREVQKNGDFLKLLQLQQPVYLSSTSAPFAGADEQELTPAQLREKRFAMLNQRIANLRALLSGQQTPDPKAFCDSFNGENGILQIVTNMGLPISVSLPLLLSGDGISSLVLKCTFGVPIEVDEKALLETFASYTVSLRSLAENLIPERYSPKALDALQILDGAVVGVPTAQSKHDILGFWSRLTNSSTNFNRKRAEHMLNRYFCDDLKPITVLAPVDHTQGKHATDSGCQSCHYKLDPMAGFFKNIGILGTNFNGLSTMQFDDNAQQPMAEYVKAWANPENAPRAWNVGYIRSSTHESLNEYGESIEDLYAIIERAPEVKQCLVRRMFEHFISKDQVIDPGYLEWLANTFVEQSKFNSSMAFKATLATLVTSRTFKETNPKSTTCYDMQPGVDPANRPPCAVAFLLQKNCASCHTGVGAAGGLDLAGWTRDAKGIETFPHKTLEGTQRDANESFKRVLDRLTSTNPMLRMPLNMQMSAQDTAELYKWLNTKLDSTGAAQ